jgi:hypothetical protein
MRLYYRDDSTHLSIILSAAAILVIGLTATTMHQPTKFKPKAVHLDVLTLDNALATQLVVS